MLAVASSSFKPRNGLCVHGRVETLPGLSAARDTAVQLAWQVSRSALVEPWTWKTEPERPLEARVHLLEAK